MSKIDTVKALSKDAIIEKITAAKVCDQGYYTCEIGNKIQKFAGAEAVVAAFNNNETRYVYAELIKANAEAVVAGLIAACMAVEAKEMIIHIPSAELYAGSADLKNALSSAVSAAGVEVTFADGIVNVREHKQDLMIHLATLIDVANACDDTYVAGKYVAVGTYGNYGEMKKVACGTKVSELVAGYDDIKAVEMGGKLCTPAVLETELTCKDSLSYGTITVITSKECILKESLTRLEEQRKTTCGKCVYCREGLNQFASMTEEIQNARTKDVYFTTMQAIAEAQPGNTPCSMGRSAGEFVLGGLTNFKSEYDAHTKKKCPAGVCVSSVVYYIDPNLCTGCEDCVDECPEDCIEGKSGYIHMIEDMDCTKCGKCVKACDEEAIIATEGRVPKLPNKLTKVGKFKK